MKLENIQKTIIDAIASSLIGNSVSLAVLNFDGRKEYTPPTRNYEDIVDNILYHRDAYRNGERVRIPVLFEGIIDVTIIEVDGDIYSTSCEPPYQEETYPYILLTAKTAGEETIHFEYRLWQ